MRDAVALREKQNSTLDKIIELSNRYRAAYYKEAGDGFYTKLPTDKPDPIRATLDHQLKLLREDYAAFEEKLAKLEDRKVRDINLIFFPPGPVENVTFTVTFKNK